MIPAGTPYIVRWHDGETRFLPEGELSEAHAHGHHFEHRLLDAPAPARPEGAEEIEEYLMDADREGGEAYRKDGYKGLADYLADRIAREAGR